MGQQTYGKVALQKLAPVAPGFFIYCAGWLGDFNTTDTMEVTGAVFREAKSGPRKGKCCILVPGSKRTAYVTVAEMAAFDAASTPPKAENE